MGEWDLRGSVRHMGYLLTGESSWTPIVNQTTAKGLSINYVVQNVGMKFTCFSSLAQTLFLVNRFEHQKLNQTTSELPFGWVFGVQLGLRQTKALINTIWITYNPAACRIIVKSLVVISSACVCRRPSWPNGSSAIVCLSSYDRVLR